MPTILIVDHSSAVRRSIRSCIEHNTEWAICGEAANGAVAVEQVKRLHPQVVILDRSMPIMNGIEAAKLIASIAPKTVITMHYGEELLRDPRAAGLRNVFPKSEGLGEQLLASIQTLVETSSPDCSDAAAAEVQGLIRSSCQECKVL